MEIMTKEGVGDHDYEIALAKYKEDPEMYVKPDYEIRRAIIRIPYASIMAYKIMETGDVEVNKKEIKILTTLGNFYTDYDKKVHKYLTDCIDKIEKNIDIEYGLVDPKEEE